MPQDIPATWYVCGKKLSIEHALSFPKGGLVLARQDDAAKEWGALGSQTLVPSAFTYNPKSILGQCRGRGPGPERGRKGEKRTAVRIL